MEDKPFKRHCIRCRELFIPKNRKRHWYCGSCRSKVSSSPGLRECSTPSESDMSGGALGGSNGYGNSDNW